MQLSLLSLSKSLCRKHSSTNSANIWAIYSIQNNPEKRILPKKKEPTILESSKPRFIESVHAN